MPPVEIVRKAMQILKNKLNAFATDLSNNVSAKMGQQNFDPFSQQPM